MVYNNYGNNNGYNRGGYNKGNGGYNSGNQGGYNASNQNNANGGNNKGNNNKVGAIWRGTTKTGNEFLSITIGDKKYVAFVNTYKNAPNQPDFNIIESTMQSGNQTTTTQNNQSSGYNKGTGYGGYQKQAQTQVDTDAYYAAQNMPIGRGEFPKNEFDDSVGDINALPGNDMPVF